MREKITRGEILLLGLTAVFLVGLLGLSRQDRRAGIAVRTEITVSQEALVPDLSPLDLNSATAAELMELPGIGVELAERIVAYREEHGPFGTEDELLKVSGIGEGKLAALEGRITTEKGTADEDTGS